MAVTAQNGHLTVVELLLSKGANGNDKNNHGAPALHNVAQLGRRTIVKLLLSKGANIHDKDCDGGSALALAAQTVVKFTIISR